MDQSTSGSRQPHGLHKRLYHWADRTVNQLLNDKAAQAPLAHPNPQTNISTSGYTHPDHSMYDGAPDSRQTLDHRHLRFKVRGTSSDFFCLTLLSHLEYSKRDTIVQ